MSGLRDKLNNLRGTPRVEAPSASADLGMQLARLRPRSQGAPRRDIRGGAASLAAKLSGHLLDEGVILIERRVPLDTLHGKVSYAGLRSIGVESSPLFAAEAEARRFLFLDTETTGLSGGTGTVVFLLGLARLVDDALCVRQYLLTSFAGEAVLYAHVAQWLSGGEQLVTYNGKTFDMPLLSSRCRLAGVADPFAATHHFDLLHVTRRAFASRWVDCRLTTAESMLCGFTRQDDLPGSQAPVAWNEFLRFGDDQRLCGVVEHNYWDILSLAALLSVLDTVYRDPSAYDADILALARFAQQCGEDELALRQLAENSARLCEQGLLELAWCLRRRGEWTQAVAIWRELSERGNTEAIERLAKFFEHQEKDFASALACTETLIARDARHQGHRERRARLLSKLAGATPELLTSEL